MRPLILAFFFLFIVITVNAQLAKPCKVVKKGMTQAEVLKLCGHPGERDSLGHDKKTSDAWIIVWQYGTIGTDDNQRVQFEGDKVVDVFSNGKKFDELIARFRKQEIKDADLPAEIEKINVEGCK